MRMLEGSFETVQMSIAAGSYSAEMDQPLSRLRLLEPESEDGVVAWNVADRYFGDGKYYPIYKVNN